MGFTTPHNVKAQAPNDIHMNNQFIPIENVKSEYYHTQIERLTENQKNKLNIDKLSVKYSISI